MTRRVLLVAFALVASLLVVTAMPAAAVHGSVVVSSHTTDTDFNGATLTNMSVSGSGESATVQASPEEPHVDAECDSFYPFNESNAVDACANNDGTLNGDPTHNSGGGQNGDGGFTLDGGGDYIDFGDTFDYTDQSFTIVVWVKDSSFGSNENFFAKAASATGSDRTYQLRHQSGTANFAVWDGNTEISVGGDSMPSDTWQMVTAVYHVDDRIEIFQNDSETGETSTGDISLNSNAGSAVIGRLGDADVEYFAGDIGEARVYDTALSTSQISDLYDNTKPDSSGFPAEYLHNHSATNTVGGFANVTAADNVTITATWEGDSNGDGSYDTTLNETSGITLMANHTFTWSEFDGDDVRLNLTVESTGTSEVFTLAGEGVNATGNQSDVNNSSATPTGQLTTATPTLEIDVNDSDFPTAQGDSVDVEFFVDGSSIGTDTLTSNGTASQTVSPLAGGDHTWHVVANDSYEHSVTSETFDISTPGNITFRRETPVHEIIDDRQINGTIFGEDDGDQYVMNFTTNDGNVSLQDAPVGERLVVKVETTGYHDREVVITDVFDQTNMYLLNTSESSVTITFDIQDTTGDFSTADTEFIVQRSINRSLFDTGGFTTEAIAGDRIGASTQYITVLEEEGRYRIIIRNPGEATRVLGAQIAKQDGTIPIRINSVDLEANQTQGFNASANIIESGGNEFVEFVYVDNEDATSEVEVTIFEYNNESNVIYDQTSTGTFGTLKVTQQLTGDEVNDTWAVRFNATRGSDVESGTIIVGQDTNPLGVPLDDAWKGRIALLSLIVVGFIVGGGVSPEAGGIGIVSAAGMWFFVGWMPAEVTAVSIGFGAITAVGFAAGKRGGEPVQ